MKDKPDKEAQSREVLGASLTSKQNRLATSQNGEASSESLKRYDAGEDYIENEKGQFIKAEDVKKMLKEIIKHGTWKHLLEVYEKDFW